MKCFRLLFKVLLVVALVVVFLNPLPVYLAETPKFTSNSQADKSILKVEQEEVLAIVQENGKLFCHQAVGLEQVNFLSRTASENLRVITPEVQQETGRLKIIMRGTKQLEEFPEAKAAFLRAAAKWESFIQTPITIVIDVDFGPKFFGSDFPPLGDFVTLGLSTLQILSANYSSIRSDLISTASNQDEMSLYNLLPTEQVFTDLGGVSRIFSSSSLFRVYKRISPVAEPDKETNLGLPPKIGFNSQNRFDFDPRDVIDLNAYDFEGLALHEIGHILGFNSNAGSNNRPSLIAVWDLFRFRSGIRLDTFTSTPRILSPGGDQFFFFGRGELEVSTGISGGDGRQTSHWKDNVFIGGQSIGVMDPIRNFGETTPITINDLLALDTFGYKISDFALEFSPSPLILRRGERGEIPVKINRENGYNGLVTIFPPDTKDLNIKLSKKVETTQTTASFKFKIKKNATLGVKELEFVAQDEAGRKRTTKLVLEIQ